MELKPCPFCGSEPQVSTDKRGWMTIACVNLDCHIDVQGGESVHAEAARLWNTRALDAKLGDGLSEFLHRTFCMITIGRITPKGKKKWAEAADKLRAFLQGGE